MSWDLTLHDDRGHEEGWWNYTHNTNSMIREAARVTGQTIEWSMEDIEGLPGPALGDYLMAVVGELEANAPKYDAMNPENGWGSRETLVPVLKEMIAKIPEWPTVWSASF